MQLTACQIFQKLWEQLCLFCARNFSFRIDLCTILIYFLCEKLYGFHRNIYDFHGNILTNSTQAIGPSYFRFPQEWNHSLNNRSINNFELKSEFRHSSCCLFPKICNQPLSKIPVSCSVQLVWPWWRSVWIISTRILFETWCLACKHFCFCFNEMYITITI